jgi:gluconate 2-dehydrogenase gamma chain
MNATELLPVSAAAVSEDAPSILQSHFQQKALPENSYIPKYFNQAQFRMIELLCDAIIPPDDEFGGASEARTAEFIDTSAHGNRTMQIRLSGGLAWLDSLCKKEFGCVYMQCTPTQRSCILELLAYRHNAKSRPELCHGIEFFDLLRRLTADAFFTSKIGIDYLGYIGNTKLEIFPGCRWVER